MKTKNRCADCKHYRIQPKNIQKGECRVEPPKVFLIPTADGPVTLSAWPVVDQDKDCACFEDEPKIQMEN